ncbi:hypothetical protein CVV26_02720 [Candidatus Kuenenbacteria bacterium HGW-Kuenenbacteria-1]|uniref:Uncharacterized protein n=1 Tax=Candidatus Kuenenbacteria bacterium HGW-Kuenenbacteria-1 TaxID=2013812 RepID=A0A2N1UN03_9BACT|nr:MAG: hypothetical protein CVV26_02720 [Candidatus Kuenenbacteria bacterium HGW-Kuenenbacteria-1]
MPINKGLEKLSDLLKTTSYQHRPAPTAYVWQDLALRIIKELNIPNFKKNSIFKVCKENSQTEILRRLNDTKELCKTGPKWQYFFKLITKDNKS